MRHGQAYLDLLQVRTTVLGVTVGETEALFRSALVEGSLDRNGGRVQMDEADVDIVGSQKVHLHRFYGGLAVGGRDPVQPVAVSVVVEPGKRTAQPFQVGSEPLTAPEFLHPMERTFAADKGRRERFDQDAGLREAPKPVPSDRCVDGLPDPTNPRRLQSDGNLSVKQHPGGHNNSTGQKVQKIIEAT